jgi:hypothetical protein
MSDLSYQTLQILLLNFYFDAFYFAAGIKNESLILIQHKNANLKI